jgi:NAD(P)-dependent dehydrogenase (short-subunit alcohol dehydrogenase family)
MKHVLITGANRGLGLGHTQAFAARGIHVFATARSPEEADELQTLAASNKGMVSVLRYDAALPEAGAQLKAAIGDTAIDLLLANAGALGGSKQSFGSVDAEDLLQLLRVNSVAPLKLVEAFADNVARSARKIVALQSSQLGSITNNAAGGLYAYRMAKAALNMVARSLAVDLRPRGITVVSLHPGWVKTRMGDDVAPGKVAPVTVEQSVQGQQRLFDRLDLQLSGRFFNFDGTELPW